MPRLLQSAIAALGLLTIVAAGSVADGPQYASPTGWGNPGRAANAAWQGEPRGASQSAAPRLLPPGGGLRHTPDYPAADGSQQRVRQVAGQQPLRLSGEGVGRASPLGDPAKNPLVTGAASLGVVLALFLAVVWVVRRGLPKGAGMLPTAAVEVLGRAPLAGRQQVHLVRCGNKVVLLSVTPTGVEPLTEISDPLEVERICELCDRAAASATPLRSLWSRAAQRAAQRRGSEQADQLDFRHLELDARRSA